MRILLFLVERLLMKMHIIRYYLLPNSASQKVCDQKHEYVSIQN